MGDPPSPRTSIRSRLLIFLTGSLLFMIVGAAIVTYRVAVYASNDAYDRSLLDPALDIADHVSSDGARARNRRRTSKPSISGSPMSSTRRS